MMDQFEVIRTKLCVYITIRVDEWHWAWGFNRVVKQIPIEV